MQGPATWLLFYLKYPLWLWLIYKHVLLCPQAGGGGRAGVLRANTNKKSKQENVLFDRTEFVRTLNMFLSWPCLTKPPIVHRVSSCQLWFVHCGGWSGVEPYLRILLTVGSTATWDLSISLLYQTGPVGYYQHPLTPRYNWSWAGGFH